MPYQVTMDRVLSDEDLDRLQVSNYNRRKWNTKFATESDEEFAEENKTFIKAIESSHPTGRWRVVRWIHPKKLVEGDANFSINQEDPLKLEAHEDNNCPIISASFCFQCIETREDGHTWSYMPDEVPWLEEMQQDWEQNGGAGDVRTTLGITDFGLWSDNADTGETSRTQTLNWCLEETDKGIVRAEDGHTIADHSKISLVPQIRFFKSIGVTHHGYMVKGQIPKTFAWDYQHDTDSVNRQKINGRDRNQSPSDFCWPVAFNLNKDESDTTCFVAQYLNQEDAVRLGPSDITDYGWPGTK